VPKIISVDRRDIFASTFRNPPVARGCYAAVLLLNKPDARIFAGVLENPSNRSVPRAIVDDDDLKLGMTLGSDTGESPVDCSLGIESRNDNANKGQACPPAYAIAFPRPDDERSFL
jgi:hypothetical protein